MYSFSYVLCVLFVKLMQLNFKNFHNCGQCRIYYIMEYTGTVYLQSKTRLFVPKTLREHLCIKVTPDLQLSYSKKTRDSIK